MTTLGPPANDPRMRAKALVASVEQDHHQVSTSDRDALVEALTADLGAAADQATITEARLEKVEAQTLVIAEAVIAITETPPRVAVAVDAVKDEM